jgi:hypothetical protein
MDRHRLFAAAVLILAVFAMAPVEVGAAGATNGQFCILNIQPNFDPILSNGYIITWNAAPGRTNYLTYTDSLGAPWQDLVGILPTSPTAMVATDYPPAGATQRFYRVRANRSSLVMSLVLDRSGSMQVNGGSTALPPAVTDFIQNFDDMNDLAAMVSFASAASTDVAMQHPFKTLIDNAANALVFNGCCVTTCSDQGLTNALAQNNSMTFAPGQDVVKVIVFFTDGMANTFNYNFNCGPRNIDYNRNLYDPATGNVANSGCSIPGLISSINPPTGNITPNAVDTTSCAAMHFEAENRAERIAWLARSQGNTIYCVGLGNPSGFGECNNDFPILNPVFLKDVANTPDSATYDPNQRSGIFVTATDASQLQAVFQAIAQQLLTQ